MVHSVSPGSSMAFRQISRNRRGRPDDLIGKAFQWSRYPHHERNRDAGGFEGLAVGDEVGGW